MGYSAETGYIPESINEIMAKIMVGINDQFGTSYTLETFIGTNFYKYFYALAQKVQTNEIKASEVFLKVQDYFAFTNERILNPQTTPNGLIDVFEARGYRASLKKITEEDAGKVFVCVDVDDEAEDYAATKLAICTIIKDFSVAGTITQGDQTETLTLTNGQAFDFSFVLPSRIPVLLRLTITVSRNNQTIIGSPEQTRLKLFDNINAEYRLGRDFEPERYFSVLDAPWASDILLEYSLDEGETWLTDVYESAYDDLFTILVENIEIVED